MIVPVVIYNMLGEPKRRLKDRFNEHRRPADKTNIKGAVTRQSSSCCLILPITPPQSLWNLK